MKRIAIMVMLLCTMGYARAQKLEIREVPEAVMIAFRKANPGFSGNPQWRKDKNNYQAKCMINKCQKTFTYTKLGSPVVNDPNTALTVLPPAIKEYIDRNYPGATVDKVLRIIKPDKSVNYNVGVKDTDLFFDANGKFLKSSKII